MTRRVVSVDLDTTLREVITPLTERGFGAVPVVDDEQRVVGIVSDIAENMLASHLRCVPVVDNTVLVRSDDVISAQLRTLLVADGRATITGAFQDEAARRVVEALARTVPGVRHVHLA